MPSPLAFITAYKPNVPLQAERASSEVSLDLGSFGVAQHVSRGSCMAAEPQQ